MDYKAISRLNRQYEAQILHIQSPTESLRPLFRNSTQVLSTLLNDLYIPAELFKKGKPTEFLKLNC